MRIRYWSSDVCSTVLPAVAAMADLVVARLDGLVLAETGRHEALRRDAQVDKLQDHGECARLRQFPVRGELRTPVDRHPVGMAVDPQDPVYVPGDFVHQPSAGVG